MIFSGCELLRKGDYVHTTGKGRVVNWSKIYGMITRKEGNHISVKWEGTSFEDDMSPTEIELVIKTPLFERWKKKNKFNRVVFLRKRFNLSHMDALKIYRPNPAKFPINIKEQFFVLD